MREDDLANIVTFSEKCDLDHIFILNYLIDS